MPACGRREGGSFVLPGGLDPVSMDTAALQQQRKAWTRLLVLGEAAATPHIVLSRDRDGMDLLAEEYEKRTGSPPMYLGQIALPAAYPEPAGFIEQVRRFREEGAELLARLQERLNGQTVHYSTGGFSGRNRMPGTPCLRDFSRQPNADAQGFRCMPAWIVPPGSCSRVRLHRRKGNFCPRRNPEPDLFSGSWRMLLVDCGCPIYLSWRGNSYHWRRLLAKGQGNL